MSDLFQRSQDVAIAQLGQHQAQQDAKGALAGLSAQERKDKKAAERRAAEATVVEAYGQSAYKFDPVNNPAGEHNLLTDGMSPINTGDPEWSYIPDRYIDTFTKIIKDSPNPQDEEYKLRSSYFLSTMMNVPIEEAYTNQDSIMDAWLGKTLGPKSNFEAIKNTWNAAWITNEIAKRSYSLWKKGITGAQNLAQDPDYQAILELEKQMPAQDVLKRDLPTQAIQAFAQFVPSLAESAKAGATGGAAVGAAAYGLAAIGAAADVASLGTLTIPAIALLGFGVGSGVGGGLKSAELETGSAYYDMLRFQDPQTGARINPDAAILWSGIYGGLAAVVESLQVGTLFEAIPGLGEAGKKALLKATQETLKDKTAAAERSAIMQRAIGRFAAERSAGIGERVGDIIGETAEETIQQALQLGANEMARQVTERLDGTTIQPAQYDEIRDSLVQTAVGSAMGFSIAHGAKGIGRMFLDAQAEGSTVKKTIAARGAEPKATADVAAPTPEDRAAYAKAAKEPLPANLYIQKKEEIEGQQYVLKVGDKETGKSAGFIRYSLDPTTQENGAPGAVTIHGLKAGMAPNAQVALANTLAGNFPGWDINMDAANKDQAALKDYMVSANPRGSSSGMQWNAFAPEPVSKVTTAAVTEAFRKYRPEWTEDSVQAPAQAIAMFANDMGVQPDELARNILDARIFDPTLLNKSDQAIAAQGATGAFRQVRQADGSLKGLVDMAPHANGSTAMHEMTHAVIEWARTAAATSEKAAAFMDRVETAMGIQDHNWDAAFTGWTDEYKGGNRTFREAFTYALEDYLTFGKAPKPELQSLFDRFAKWIRDIYQSLKGARVQMSDSMTSYFDRLFTQPGSPYMTTTSENAVRAEAGIGAQATASGQGQAIKAGIDTSAAQAPTDAATAQDSRPGVDETLELFQGDRNRKAAGHLRDLEEAKRQAAAGIAPEEIAAATGWQQHDGEWRLNPDHQTVPFSKDLREQERKAQEAPQAMTVPLGVANFTEKAYPQEGPTATATIPRKLYQGDGWTYKSEQVIAEKLKGPMPGNQIKRMLEGAGVKAEEMTWTGLDEFLATDKKITPQELKDYLAANKLKIEEVEKGGPTFYGTEGIKYLGIEHHGVDFHIFEVPGNILQLPVSKYPTEQAARDYIATKERKRETTKFSQYTLPGGDHYREVLFTLPHGKDYQARLTGKDVWEKKLWEGEWIVLKNGEFQWAFSSHVHRDPEGAAEKRIKNEQEKNTHWVSFPTREERNAAIKEEYGEDALITYPGLAREVAAKGAYVSSHWDETPNVLAHTRLDDRTDAQGRKMLFVEEIQSDWHQDGRKKGYNVPIQWKPVKDYFIAEVHDGEELILGPASGYDISKGWAKHGEWTLTRSGSGATESFATKEEAIDSANAGFEGLSTKGVPDAPFKKTWHEFVFKRILREAVDKGYEVIGWTTGEQQSKRYNLSQYVTEIRFQPSYKDNKWAVTTVGRNNEGDLVENGTLYTPKEIAETFGKDVADKIVERRKGTITGIDLTVGGEGMKGFYDKMLVDYANKIGKKWGAKVEDATINVVHSGDDPYVIASAGTGIDDETIRPERFASREEAEAFARENNLSYYEVQKLPTNIIGHSLPVTDAMREAISTGGLPLFQGEWNEPIDAPDDPHEAIARMMKKRWGYLAAVVTRPDIGPIAIPWGDMGDLDKEYAGGWGLSHIEAKHESADQIIEKIPEILERGRIEQDPSYRNRWRITWSQYRAVVQKDREGEPFPWLVTAFIPESMRIKGAPAGSVQQTDRTARSGTTPPRPVGLTERTTPANRRVVKIIRRKKEIKSLDQANIDPPLDDTLYQMDNVWHGSTAGFDEFDHSFMSTGEGAQVYGWGTYISNNRHVAKDSYAGSLAKEPQLNIGNNTLDWMGIEDILTRGKNPTTGLPTEPYNTVLADLLKPIAKAISKDKKFPVLSKPTVERMRNEISFNTFKTKTDEEAWNKEKELIAEHDKRIRPIIKKAIKELREDYEYMAQIEDSAKNYLQVLDVIEQETKGKDPLYITKGRWLYTVAVQTQDDGAADQAQGPVLLKGEMLDNDDCDLMCQTGIFDPEAILDVANNVIFYEEAEEDLPDLENYKELVAYVKDFIGQNSDKIRPIDSETIKTWGADSNFNQDEEWDPPQEIADHSADLTRVFEKAVTAYEFMVRGLKKPQKHLKAADAFRIFSAGPNDDTHIFLVPNERTPVKGEAKEPGKWLRWDEDVPFDDIRKIHKKAKELDENIALADDIFGMDPDIEEDLETKIYEMAALFIGYDYQTLISGGEWYEAIAEAMDSPKAASLFLHWAGYDGTKVPAFFRTGGKGERGFNYAVFSDKAIVIEERILWQAEAIRSIEELADMAQEAGDWKDWHDRNEQALKEAFGSDTPLFKKILAATSQAASVPSNVALAVKAYDQFLSGKPFTGYLPPVIKNLTRIRDEEPIMGDKIAEYNAAVEGNDDGIAIDRHLGELLFGTDKVRPQHTAKGKEIVQAIGERLGWTPRGTQAALWAYNQIRKGMTPQSYDSFVRKKLTQIRAIQADNGRTVIEEIVLHQGDRLSRSQGQLYQADGDEEAGLSTLKETARTFDTWEEFAQYLETFETDNKAIPQDMGAKERYDWYKAMWEAAKTKEAPPDLKTWAEGLKANEYAGLYDFLEAVWSDILLTGNTKPESPEELTIVEAARDLRGELAEVIVSGAQAVGKGRQNLSRKFLDSIMGVIGKNPEEYARIYGQVMNDQAIGSLGAAAEAEKYTDIQDPKLKKGAMSISERAALAAKIRSDTLASDVISGKVQMDAKAKTYLDDLLKKQKADAKKIKGLETDLRIDEKTLEEKDREIAKVREETARTDKEIAQAKRRIDRFVERGQKVPKGLTQILRTQEERAKALKSKLQRIGDWETMDSRARALETRIASYDHRVMEYRESGQEVPSAIIQNREKAKRELRDLGPKMAKAGELWKDKAGLQTYLTKMETLAKTRESFQVREAERKAIGKLRSYTEALVRSIMKKPGDTIHVQQQKAILQIQRAIDPEWRKAATQEEIDALRAELDANPDLAREIPRKWLDRAFKKNLSEMTLQEIEETARQVQNLRMFGRALKAAQDEERRQWTETRVSAITEIIRADPSYNEPKGYEYDKSFVDRFKDKLRTADFAFLNMRRIATTLDGGTDGQNVDLLWHEMNRKYRTEMEGIDRRTGQVMEAFKAAGVDPRTWYNTTIDVQGAGPGRATKTLRKSDLMALDMAFANEDSRAAALYGNFFSQVETDEMDDEELLFEGSHRFGMLRAAIDAVITPQDLQVITALGEDSNQTGKRLADVVGAVENRIMEAVENYFPIRRLGVTQDPIDVQIAGDMLNRTAGLKRPPKNGFTKARVSISPKHQSPIKLDLLTTYLESIQAQEHYLAFAEYGKQLDSVYTNPYMQEHIKALIGDQGVKYVKEYITEVKNPAEYANRNQWEAAIRYLRGNLGAAYLTFRASSTIKQLVTSPWPTLPYAGPRMLGEAFRCLSNPMKFLRDTEALSTVLKHRSHDMVMEAIKTAQASSPAGKGLLAMNRIGMKGLELADRFSVAIGWRAAYQKALVEFDGDEAKAVEKADDIILKTQPSARGVDLAPIYRNAGEGTKLLLQFTQAINVIWQNIRFDVPNAVKNHQFGTAIGILMSYGMAGILLNALTARPPEDETDDQKLKRLLFYTITQASDSIPLVGQDATRVIRRAITGEKEPAMPNTALPGIGDIMDGAYRLTGGDITKGVEKFAIGSGMVLGIPTSGVREISRTLGGDPEALLGRPKKD
jgi:hypothetical protein